MEELLAEKELMGLVLGLAGFTYRDLPLLAAVSRYTFIPLLVFYASSPCPPPRLRFRFRSCFSSAS
jgi:hypothetical protein